MAALHVQGKCFLEIDIESYGGLPFEHVRLDSFVLNSSGSLGFPSGSICFTDAKNVFGNYVPQTGQSFLITVGPSVSNTTVYPMKAFNVRQTPAEKGNSYDITLIMDSPLWVYQGTTQEFVGTSAQAISNIASECGLSSDVDATNDKQVWLPIGRRNFQWARDVASKGWADNSSCMILGVTLTGKIVYKNINSMSFKDVVVLSTPGLEHQSGWFVWSKEQNNQAGTWNSASLNSKTQDNTPNRNQTHTKVLTKRIANRTGVSDSEYNSYSQGRLNMAPVDTGNSHIMSVQAKHQNSRIRGLMAASLRVAGMQAFPLDLFDPVNLNLLSNESSSGAQDKLKNGPYIVWNKTIFIGSNIQYVEGYELVRDGAMFSNAQTAPTK